MLECIPLLGLYFCGWIQSTPLSASQLYTRIGVVWGLEPYRCPSTPRGSKPWMFPWSTQRVCFLPFWSYACPNPSPVACCLSFLFSSPPEFFFYIDSKNSQPTAGESTEHYQNHSMAASSGMSSIILQPPFPSAGVHLEPDTNSSAPGYWANSFPPETNPPILSSTCWMHHCWPASCFWQIVSRRIWFASDWLAVWCLHCQYLTNRCSHHLHLDCHRASPAIEASLQSLHYLVSAVPPLAGRVSLGG